MAQGHGRVAGGQGGEGASTEERGIRRRTARGQQQRITDHGSLCELKINAKDDWIADIMSCL